MRSGPQRAMLDAERADLDQQIRAVDSRRDLSDGQKLLLRRALHHQRRERDLERQIENQMHIVKSRESSVEAACKERDWAKTPNGLEVLAKAERRRIAAQALGGSDRHFAPLRDPEQAAMHRVRGNLQNAERNLQQATLTLDDLRRRMRELK